MHRHLGPGYLFSSILSIKCASTTYMNPFDMLHCEINAFIWTILKALTSQHYLCLIYIEI
jgi:hypothetical protein